MKQALFFFTFLTLFDPLGVGSVIIFTDEDGQVESVSIFSRVGFQYDSSSDSPLK